MKHVLLQTHYRGVAAKHMVVWSWARWSDWREKNKHRYEDVDAKFIVQTGSRKAMAKLRKTFEDLAKGDKDE